MISATPNSVRWDQVNRVTYRFQALNFQSDVLEALVLNSPPLSRRSRRKPIIRVSDCTGNRVEFLQARSLERRSQSFDEGITNHAKHETKFCEKSRVSHDRYVSGRADVSSVLLVSNQKQNTNDENELVKLPESTGETSEGGKAPQLLGDDEISHEENDSLHGNEILCAKKDDDLQSKSKEYLIQLVKDLRNKLRSLNEGLVENIEISEPEENLQIVKSESQHLCKKCNEIDDRNADHKYGEEYRTACQNIEVSSSSYHDGMVVNMKQLESEVLRTRRIAAMFEDEVSGLKTRFSSLLEKASDATMVSTVTQKLQRSRLNSNCIGEVAERKSETGQFFNVELDNFQSKSEADYSRSLTTVAEVSLLDDHRISKTVS